jgi:predicted dehydrogenase
LRVGVIGAGLIGNRRAAVAAKLQQLAVVADIDEGRALELAHRYACRSAAGWEEVVNDPSIDIVAVCTTNKFLAPISIAALQAGKHVLCEKPLGRNADEAGRIADAARAAGKVLKVGFTLRFHPGIREAHRICASGSLGPLFFVRGVYGHGGRPGYDKEWRGNVELAGGGELLDQGVHLLDLSRWFLGELEVVAGLTPRWYWPVEPLEDNAFILLRGSNGVIANLQTSWTQWKNRFSFEVFGRDGYARVEGLGGSYGAETLTIGRRLAEGGVPQESTIECDDPDLSWEADWRDMVTAVEMSGRPEVDGECGLAVMMLVEDIYSFNVQAKGRIVPAAR